MASILPSGPEGAGFYVRKRPDQSTVGVRRYPKAVILLHVLYILMRERAIYRADDQQSAAWSGIWTTYVDEPCAVYGAFRPQVYQYPRYDCFILP